MKHFVIFFAAVLTACTGMPTKEIRHQLPVWSQIAEKNLTSTLRCLTEHPDLEQFSQDRMRVLTFPNGKQVDIAIGAMQFGDFKNFYLISLKQAQDATTTTELRRSETDFFPMNQETLVKVLGSCL